MDEEKQILWVGSSYRDLLAMPASIRRKAGSQLSKVQAGIDPEHWKPFGTIGPGVRELRLDDVEGAFRVMYVARFPEAVYVLHCSEKKSRTTRHADVQIAGTRYKAVVESRGSKQ